MARRALVGVLFVLAVVLVGAPGRAGAQELKSSDLARQLTQLLDSRKLDSIATPDITNPGTYIAALYFPGTQLLVVCAKYTAPSLLAELIARKDFRGVYVELSSASVQSTKSGDQPADSIDRAGTQSTFDGAWKKAKISEADYMKSFAEADAAYAHLLQLLVNSLKAGGM